MKPRHEWKQLKRSPLPQRATFLAHGAKPKARNAKRHAKNLVRAHGSEDRRAWTKRQPCYVCGRTPSDAAHMRSGGTGRKSDVAHTAPLCSSAFGYVGHHEEFDAGKQSFAKKYDFDRDVAAAETDVKWLAHLERVA